jgi:hypothetical protein
MIPVGKVPELFPSYREADMNLRKATLIVTVSLILSGDSTCASATSNSSPSDCDRRQRTVVVRTSDLRSAYLIRNGQVHYDAANATRAELRSQLQRHFDTVVALLMLSTQQNIELALDRLEAERPMSWSVAERAAWRERLLANRRAQITRLVEYRRRGLFPLNEGQATKPVPIFVDRHDTACAVGHLMRRSGREQEVADVQLENNLVYVPDVTTGTVVAWILTSGITLEEAALIQPAYGPVLLPKPENAIEVMNDKESFEFENLRYSNFKAFAGDDPAVPVVNIPVSHTACSWYGCGTTFPVILDPNPFLDVTQLPDADLTLRGLSQHALEAGPPLLTSFPRVVVQFDVEVTAPNLRIANVPHGGSLLSNSYFDGSQFRLFVNDSRDRVWIDQRHNPAPECEGVFCGGWSFAAHEMQFEVIGNINPPDPRSANFQPTDRLTIVTEMYIPPDQEFRGQFINFSLVAVPEPASLVLAAVSVGLCAAVRSRRRIG